MSNETGSDRTATSAADTSALDVLHLFQAEGWAANHLVMPGADIRCGRCGAVVPAATLTAEVRHRVEGASDPADMQEVVGLRCAAYGAAGAVVVSYGPQSSEDDQDFLLAIDTANAFDPLGATGEGTSPRPGTR
jgi:hypothetical protein